MTRPTPGIVTINEEPFFLATDDARSPQWHPRRFPWQEGDGSRPRKLHIADWSRGMGDSRAFYPGAIEYGELAFLPPGRILPSPAISSITSGLGGNVTCFTEVTAPANRILAGGATKVIEINPSDHTVATTVTPGGTVLSLLRFESDVLVALGDSTVFQKRNSSGTWATNTLTGNYRYARAFGLSGDRPVAGYANYWRKLIDGTSDYYGTDANWGTDYPIGDGSGKVTQVFSRGRADYVLKEEGLYTFDPETSEESLVLPDLKVFKSAENRAFGFWSEATFICSFAGLYRYLASNVARTVGTEEMELNEASELANSYPTAAIAIGHWAYVAFYNPGDSKTRLMMMRRASEGDANPRQSPYTLVSVIDVFTGECRAMHLSSLSGLPRLYFDREGDVGHFALTRDGVPSAYQTANTTIVRLGQSDLGTPETVKYLRRFAIKARNVTANNTVTLKVKRDDGSWETVGASALTSLSSQIGERFWTQGTNDSAKVVGLRFDLTNVDGSTSPVEIRDAWLDFEERPETVAGGIAILRLRDQQAGGAAASRKSAAEQRAVLEAAIEAGSVAFIDPDGTAYRASISSYEGDTDYQLRGEGAEGTVTVMVREMPYA